MHVYIWTVSEGILLTLVTMWWLEGHFLFTRHSHLPLEFCLGVCIICSILFLKEVNIIVNISLGQEPLCLKCTIIMIEFKNV